MSEDEKIRNIQPASRSVSRIYFTGIILIFFGFLLVVNGISLFLYRSNESRGDQTFQPELARRPDTGGRFLYDLGDFLTVEGVKLGWTKVEEGNFSISYYGGDRSKIRFITEALKKVHPRIAAHLGTDSNEKIQVVLFPSSAELRSFIKYSNSDNISGLAVPQLDTIFISLHSPGQPADFVAVHELTHLILRQAVLPHQAPLWLDEGIATYEGIANPGTAYRLELSEEFKQSAATEDFLTFAEIEQVSSTADLPDERAGLWYTASYSLVDFIARTYGESKFQRLLDSLKTGGDSFEAVEYALGFSPRELEVKWRASLAGVEEAKIAEIIGSRPKSLEEKISEYQSLIIRFWSATSFSMVAAFVLFIFMHRRFLRH